MPKIRHYDYTVREHLGILSEISGTDQQIEDVRLLRCLFSTEPKNVMDRTGFFFKGINFDYTPIPSVDLNFPKKINDIIDERAKEIADTYSHIYVLWSGGVDSTTILTSIMQHIKTKDQVTVICSQSSIDEYPWFYNKFKEDYRFIVLGFVDFYQALHDEISDKKNYIALHGHPADQLFTNQRWFILAGGNKDWRDLVYDDNFNFPRYHNMPNYDKNHPYIKKYGTSRELDKEDKKYFIEKMEDHIYNFGIKIPNTYHFFWWLVFCFSYQNKSKRYYSDYRTMFLNIQGFFDTDDFQKWCMRVHLNDELVSVPAYDIVETEFKMKSSGGNAKQYKKDFKEYIYKYTKDEEYRDNKPKRQGMEVAYDWEKANIVKNGNGIRLLDNNGDYILTTTETVSEDLYNVYTPYLNY